MTGLDVCHYHGGAKGSPARNALEVRQQARRARQLADLDDSVPVRDVYAALRDHAGLLVRFRDILTANIAELESMTVHGRRHPLLTVFLETAGEVRLILEVMARLGIEERQLDIETSIAEATLNRLDLAFQTAVAMIGLDPGQVAKLKAAYGQQLHQLGPASDEEVA